MSIDRRTDVHIIRAAQSYGNKILRLHVVSEAIRDSFLSMHGNTTPHIARYVVCSGQHVLT